MSGPERHPGSFRDPSGHVYVDGSELYRTISPGALEGYRKVKASGLLDELAAGGLFIGCEELAAAPRGLERAALVVRHPRVPYVSYPYEWGFGQLKAAALCHLEVQLRALEKDVMLSDASAYNVQFVDARPVFIDLLSLRPYRAGEHWEGHRQFCEQFLGPLLLRAYCGVPHNAWFRGALEGIPHEELARLLPLRRRLGLKVLAHIVLPARYQRKAGALSEARLKAAAARELPKRSLRNILLQLRDWIASLAPAGGGETTWSGYAATCTYTAEEAGRKARLVSEFCAQARPRLLADLGCNVGQFSAAALAGGAERSIGFDFDQGALELAHARSREEKLRFLPLYLDAANPSPGQGWAQAERPGFAERACFDALIALAFAHHLAIGRNVPLPELLGWLTSLAPRGVVEFVRKDDPTVQRMLLLRKDIFEDYSREAFEAELAARARIVRQERSSASGRVLYWYERS